MYSVSYPKILNEYTHMTNNLPATRRNSWLRDDPSCARPCRACVAKDRNDQQHGSNSRPDLTLAVVKREAHVRDHWRQNKKRYLSTISELVLTLTFQDEGHKPTATTLDKSQISPAFKTWPEKRSPSKRICRKRPRRLEKQQKIRGGATARARRC